jgi:hypothetical protein
MKKKLDAQSKDKTFSMKSQLQSTLKEASKINADSKPELNIEVDIN